ncbi:MAG: helix-turn-helix domain-containing protein [Bacteroidota bacterium]
MQVNIFDIVILLGSLQGILFAVYLTFKPIQNKKANTYLVIFILTFALSSLNIALEGIGLKRDFSPIGFLPLYCSNLILPSFYLFVLYLLQPNRKLKRIEVLLFIPFLFQFVSQSYFLIVAIFSTNEILKNINAIISINNWIDNVMLLLGLVLLILSYFKINTYQKTPQKKPIINKVNLSWLKRIVLILLIIWVLVLIPTVYEQYYLKPSIDIFYPALLVVSVFIYWIGYTAYSFKYTIEIEEYVRDAKLASSELPGKTAEYYHRLLKLMEEQRLYTIPELELSHLAKKLDLSNSYLSRIINKYESKNFHDFINTYRVEEVKRKIDDGNYDHLNLLGIALESGFRSKSTFNLAFKKLEGITPAHYKKSKIKSKNRS